MHQGVLRILKVKKADAPRYAYHVSEISYSALSASAAAESSSFVFEPSFSSSTSTEEPSFALLSLLSATIGAGFPERVRSQYCLLHTSGSLSMGLEVSNREVHSVHLKLLTFIGA